MGTLRRCLILAGLLTVGLTQIAPAAQAATAGVRDFAYSGSAPTGQKPQSKLWFNDGSWWGILWSKAQGGFTVQKFDWNTDKWTDQGSTTKLDTRNRGQADVTWTGSKLYVTSNIDPTVTNTTDKATKLWRLSYNSSTKKYAIDSGFPVTLVSSAVESVTFDRAYDGKLWFTYTLDQSDGSRKLFVRHSTTSDTTWGAAFTPNVTGATGLSADDISSLVAYKGTDGVGKIGVMWSNQATGTMYYISHIDGQADTSWTQNPAVTGADMADDHLALRSLNGDANGNVVAVMKTSLNDVEPATSINPLIQVGVLQPNGVWKKAVFSRVVDNHTRAIVEIDRTNRQLYVFASAPCCSGGAIYMKKTSLDNPDFSDQVGMGTPFMQNPTDVNINNPTSSKQELNSTTGILVEASDDHTKFYLHNKVALTSGPVTPAAPSVTAPADNSSDNDGNVTVSGTAPAGSTVELFDGATSKGTQTANASTGAFSFTLTGVADGAHTYTAKATTAGGTSGASNAVTVNVDTAAPGAPVISSPASPTSDSTGSVTFSGTAEAGSSVQLYEGATAVGTPVTATGGTWTKTVSGIANGSHTYTAKATDAASNTSVASNAVTVNESPPPDNTNPTVQSVSPGDGATGVGVSANASATFSEAMNASTITSSTFTLVKTNDSSSVAGAVSYDSASRTATFNPTADLAPDTSYTATVGTGAQDLAGNGLTAAKTWSFRTAPASPPPPAGIVRQGATSTANATATSTLTINTPNLTVAGDVLVACVATNGGTVKTAPAGWTPIASVTGITNPHVFGYYRVATSLEPASYTWTLSASVANGGGIARYSGVDTTTPLASSVSTATGAAAASGVIPGVTTTTPNAMVVGCMGINSSSTAITIGSPAGMSEAWDVGGKRHELADSLQAAAGASGNKSWAFSSAREWAGWLVALRPA